MSNQANDRRPAGPGGPGRGPGGPGRGPGGPGSRPPRGMRMPGMGPENPGAIFKRLVKYIAKNNAPQMCLVVVMIFINAMGMIAGNNFLRQLIDVYIVPMIGQSSPNYAPLLRALSTLGCIYIFSTFSAWGYQRIMVNVTQNVLTRMRTEMFRHMETLPIRYFDSHTHGDIMSMYTNDCDTLRQMVSQSFPQIVSSVINIVGVFISMVLLSKVLTLVTVLMVFVMMFVAKTLGFKAGMYFMAQQKDLGKENGYIEEMLSGQKVVKVFCHEEQCIKEFNELNNNLCESANNANSFANILMPVNGNLGHVSYVLCIIVGAILMLTGATSLTIGQLAAFLQFNRSFTMPITMVSQQFNAIVMALAGADRLFKLLDEEPEEDNGYVSLVRANYDEDGTIHECKERTGHWAWKHYHKADNTTTFTPMKGDIVLEHVDFGYVPDKTVLHDISLYAKPGQKIAFVGATGAGKTTITNLLNRFYDINGGSIHYDGINLKKFKKDDLRKSLGMVLQDTHLFTGTVMENIRYGRLDATDEEVKDAARLANAEYFIEHLENGYDTMLTGDGANLSQGQRQLLAIARAAVANPPVLILDEATSSIDTGTEKVVQEGMDALMKGRTVFVIAHRLSTIKNSDAIMVLDHGHIIERGNHEYLLAKKGIYWQLYTGKLEQS